jgi:hypothetical protein
MDISGEHPGLQGQPISFVSSGETVGVCPLPDSLRESLGMRKAAARTLQASYSSVTELSAFSSLRRAGNTNDEKYQYLAEKQGTRFAIVPAHTMQEYELFKFQQRQLFSGREPDWIEFAKVWSNHANGRDIFYKTPEHLKSHSNKWDDSRTFANTVSRNYNW